MAGRYTRAMTSALLMLQAFHVLFLALHDWMPLVRWNHVVATRAAHPGSKLLTTTLVSITPFVIGFAGSVVARIGSAPGWLPAY